MISNTVASLMLQLAAALREEGESREGPEVNQQLLLLVREAYEVFTTTASGVDLRDWIKTAAPFVKR